MPFSFPSLPAQPVAVPCAGSLAHVHGAAYQGKVALRSIHSPRQEQRGSATRDESYSTRQNRLLVPNLHFRITAYARQSYGVARMGVKDADPSGTASHPALPSCAA
ncbi:hypothetical protein PWT90_04454 [Aphanocladium album]|nr:hypothetical protein PWT90_04454 [Aphanocladium album]